MTARKRTSRLAGKRAGSARQEWNEHVQRTPIGMQPVLLGTAFAWRPAFGFTLPGLRDYFARVAPRRFWPEWITKPRKPLAKAAAR